MTEQVQQAASAAFERKMSLPQYAAYRDNPEAQMRLWLDILREYAASERLWEQVRA